MTANRYPVGQVVRVKDTITVNNVLTDPTSVEVRVQKPDGSVVTGLATKDSQGVYHFDVPTDQPGIWWYRFEVTSGAGQGSGQQSFVVDKDRTR